jgi:hypothetical protein
MRPGSPRFALAIALFVVLLVAAVALRLVNERRGAATSPGPRAAAPGVDGVDREKARDALAALPDAEPGEALTGADPLEGMEDPAVAWSKVDLEEIRKAMPDNIYWKMGVPTQDPEVQLERERERDRWNVEYGKVLSNTATAEEVDAYYAYEELRSSDYMEFIIYTLTHYGDVIPKRDAALLKLAGEMHLAKLEEIPRKQAEAHERRKQHEAVRQAWLAEQKAFEGTGEGGK